MVDHTTPTTPLTPVEETPENEHNYSSTSDSQEDCDEVNADRKNIRSFLSGLLPFAVAIALGIGAAKISMCEESDGRTFKKNVTQGRIEGV